MQPTKLLVAIANYDFSDNADSLKTDFEPYFPTLLIDNSSPTPPIHTDVSLPNQYYAGLWNESVRQAIKRDATWLLFAASDVRVPDVDAVAAGINDVIGDDSIGIYSPSLQPDSETAFPRCFCRKTGALRDCGIIEGFFFLVRIAVVKEMYPLDLVSRKFGWGIDVHTAYEAQKSGLRSVVDDRVQIHHPKSTHSIPRNAARRQMESWMSEDMCRFMHEQTHDIKPQPAGHHLAEWFIRPLRLLSTLFDRRKSPCAKGKRTRN